MGRAPAEITGCWRAMIGALGTDALRAEPTWPAQFLLQGIALEISLDGTSRDDSRRNAQLRQRVAENPCA